MIFIHEIYDNNNIIMYKIYNIFIFTNKILFFNEELKFSETILKLIFPH